MAERPRLVVDTNVLVSRLLAPRSVPADAMRRAVYDGVLLLSEATPAELARVLARSNFDATSRSPTDSNSCGCSGG